MIKDKRTDVIAKCKSIYDFLNYIFLKIWNFRNPEIQENEIPEFLAVLIDESSI